MDSNARSAQAVASGAARNIEGGGSLTIISTALVDTGSRMYEVIFESSGHRASRIHLDRKLRPAFPVDRHPEGGTRKESCCCRGDLNRVVCPQKVLTPLSPVEAMELLLSKMAKTKTNRISLVDEQRKGLAIAGGRESVHCDSSTR